MMRCRILKPSLKVLSLDSVPSARSRKPQGCSAFGTRRLMLCTVSSVSISNSREVAGKLFTKRREKTR